MKVAHTDHSGAFKRLLETRAAQAMLMTLAPGEASEQRPANEHPRCEQWLYVIAGRGRGVSIGAGGRRRSVQLTAGSLVVVLRGERHQIKNTGTTPLRTLNFYVPPAYDRHGEPRPTARRRTAASGASR